jgi:tetratricopeptide (TPR) repeat protein
MSVTRLPAPRARRPLAARAAGLVALVFAAIAAIGVLGVAGARAGVSPEDQLFLAADAYYTGDFTKAIQAFGDVLALEPDNAYALSRLGASLAAAGGPGADAAALAKFDAVLAKIPGHLFARTWKGLVLLRAGDPARAEAECAQALRLDPDYPPAAFVLGLARLAAGDKANALAQFARLAGRDHAEAEIHAATARVFARLGLLHAANQEWERALALRPSDPAWASALGALLARRGQDGLALTAFEQVLAEAPADARARTDLAAALAEQAWKAAGAGRPAEALALCRRALRADAGQAGCLYLARRGGVPDRPGEARETAPAALPQPEKPQSAQPAQPAQPAKTARTPAAKPAAEFQTAQSVQSAQSAQPAQPGASSAPALPGDGEATVGGALAKLRAGPGADEKVVRVLPPGLRLKILGRQGDWIEALTPGGSRGFVRADLINPAPPGQ